MVFEVLNIIITCNSVGLSGHLQMSMPSIQTYQWSHKSSNNYIPKCLLIWRAKTIGSKVETGSKELGREANMESNPYEGLDIDIS